MKARRLPARSALEQLLHQVPQRRPRLLFLPPALLNRLRLLHQLLLQQRKQILLLLLPLKQRRLLLLLLLLRQLNQLPQKLQKQLRSLLQKRRSLLRQVHTELKAIEVNERRDITEADVDAMLKRVIKQTKETLDGSIKAGNNQERTDTLTEQVAILEGYLPEQIEGEALMALIDEAVAETGATTKKDMGRVMGTLTQRTGGNFDKAAAAATLNQRLS